MDDLNNQYKACEQNLDQDPNAHPAMAAIYAWERKSMRKVQEIAEKARESLLQSIETTKATIQRSLSTITAEFHAHENADNYTETDLQRWTNQLVDIRVSLEKMTSICLVEDKKPSTSIGTLKIREQSQPSTPVPLVTVPKTKTYSIQPSTKAPQEQFVRIFGQCKLSEENLVATQASYRAGLSQISGINEYSSGRHSIRFLVERKGVKNIFIGIHSPLAQVTATNFDSTVHGWWNLDYMIISGQSEGIYDKEILQTGDQVTLTLDCDRRQILLEHHRTSRLVQLPIELTVCPFPWKLLVRLLIAEDSLRILKQ